MTTDEQGYNYFIAEATKIVSKLQLKYNTLSENEYVMPKFHALESQNLFNQIFKLVNTGINICQP